MGGIFGIVKSVQPPDLGLCREQTDTLAHRGPDSGGYFWSCSCFLGRRRRAVLDFQGQQVLSEDLWGPLVLSGWMAEVHSRSALGK